jgi:ketosteroid isomerase-like protein
MHPVARWHHILKNRDRAGLCALLADDAVFLSPVVHTPQTGKPIVMAYLAAAFEVFGNDSFRYLREIVSGRDAVLEFETTVDGVIVNGVDMLQWNEAGQVTEFKVMVRPLKGMQVIHARMAAMLEQMQRGRA